MWGGVGVFWGFFCQYATQSAGQLSGGGGLRLRGAEGACEGLVVQRIQQQVEANLRRLARGPLGGCCPTGSSHCHNNNWAGDLSYRCM